MTVASFTWQRYKQPLPPREAGWRKEERIMVAKEKAAQHPHAGKSVLDLLWEEMDAVYDQLIEEGEPEVDPVRQPSTAATRYREWGELRGQAQGLAYAIALVTNPYACDVPAVKVEARRRYEAANEK